jgi:ribosomal protein S27E
MKKVTINEQASKDGAVIICPECKHETKVFHFLWDTLFCPSCKAKIQKTDFLLK